MAIDSIPHCGRDDPLNTGEKNLIAKTLTKNGLSFIS
jgi:hypothetical protein